MHYGQTTDASYKLHVIELLTCQPSTQVTCQLPNLNVCQLTVIWRVGQSIDRIGQDWSQLPNQEQDQGAVLGEAWRGCAPTPSPWDVAFFFVFTFKICLHVPHQSVTPFLSGAPLLRKILDLPLKTQTNINIHTCYTCACTPVLYFTYKASALISLVLCLIRSLLDILARLMRFLMQSRTAKEHLSFECSMIMLVKRFEPNFD